MRLALVLAALTALGAAALLAARPAEVVAPRPTTTAPGAGPHVVRSIALDGERLPLATLRAALETRVGAPLDAELLERDRAALGELLAARGHRAAQIGPAVVTYDPEGRAYVVFEVAQGPLFRVRSVQLTGEHGEQGLVTLAPGAEAVTARLERARQMLADTLARRAAGVDVRLVVREDPLAAVVDVELVTAHPARVGSRDADRPRHDRR